MLLPGYPFHCAPLTTSQSMPVVLRCSAQVVKNGPVSAHTAGHGDAGAAWGRQSWTSLLPTFLYLRCPRRRAVWSNRWVIGYYCCCWCAAAVYIVLLDAKSINQWVCFTVHIKESERQADINVARQELAQLEGQKLWSRGQYIPRIANEMHHIC